MLILVLKFRDQPGDKLPGKTPVFWKGKGGTEMKTYYIVTRKPFIGLSGRLETWSPQIFDDKAKAERWVEVTSIMREIPREEFTIKAREV